MRQKLIIQQQRMNLHVLNAKATNVDIITYRRDPPMNRKQHLYHVLDVEMGGNVKLLIL